MIRCIVIAALLSAVNFGSAQAAFEVGFSSLPSSFIQFNADSTFTFEDEVGGSINDIQIDNSTGVGGDSVGLKGDLDGLFTIGAITVAGVTEDASVSGTGSLVIRDLSNVDLTANVDINHITTVGNFGLFSMNVLLNLTSVAYAGTNQDLQDLVSQQPSTIQMSFTASLGDSLSTLVQGTNIDNYSGSITTSAGEGPLVPEASTFVVWSTILLTMVVGAVWRKRRTVAAA